MLFRYRKFGPSCVFKNRAPGDATPKTRSRSDRSRLWCRSAVRKCPDSDLLPVGRLGLFYSAVISWGSGGRAWRSSSVQSRSRQETTHIMMSDRCVYLPSDTDHSESSQNVPS